jgi:hypothetical protein
MIGIITGEGSHRQRKAPDGSRESSPGSSHRRSNGIQTDTDRERGATEVVLPARGAMTAILIEKKVW